ncbi:MAG: hypothetical protein AB1603_06850 [Chloroflexota bacterium]
MLQEIGKPRGLEVMTAIVEERLREWVRGRDARVARVSIFEGIRDIPYAVVLELVDWQQYAEVLRLNRGSCAPKHFLLCDMYQRLGMMVLYAVYPFRWDEVGIDYPPGVRSLARALPLSYHLACRVEIQGRLVLVDATLDPALERLGLPVNKGWDGVSDTLLAVTPCGEEQLYHPSEACLMPPRPDDQGSILFYRELNSWLEEVREAPVSDSNRP